METRSRRKPLSEQEQVSRASQVQDSDHDNGDDTVLSHELPLTSPKKRSFRNRSAAIESVSTASSVKSSPSEAKKLKDTLETRSKTRSSSKKTQRKVEQMSVEDEGDAGIKKYSVDDLYGYEEQASLLKSFLKSSIEGVESNSVLICGPRGSGKTTLLDKCLKEVRETSKHSVEVMFMNGILDTDPVNLFRSVRESTGSEEVSISDLLNDLLDKTLSNKKALFFILDAFDMFCRKNQTFLYNIFDLSQKCTNIAVIGMTSRLDCLELLEKRVKSRMSQTVIHLNNPFESVDRYVDYAENVDILSSFPDKKQQKKFMDLLVKEAPCQYNINNSIEHMKRFIIQSAWESLSSGKEKDDPIISAIMSLSHLELLMLVMAFKYCKIRSLDSFPCNALVTESSKFSGRTKISRQVVYQLIQNLLSYGLFIKSSHSKTSSTFINDWSMLSVNVREEDLRSALTKMQKTLPATLYAQVNLN